MSIFFQYPAERSISLDYNLSSNLKPWRFPWGSISLLITLDILLAPSSSSSLQTKWRRRRQGREAWLNHHLHSLRSNSLCKNSPDSCYSSFSFSLCVFFILRHFISYISFDVTHSLFLWRHLCLQNFVFKEKNNTRREYVSDKSKRKKRIQNKNNCSWAKTAIFFLLVTSACKLYSGKRT